MIIEQKIPFNCNIGACSIYNPRLSDVTIKLQFNDKQEQLSSGEEKMYTKEIVDYIRSKFKFLVDVYDFPVPSWRFPQSSNSSIKRKGLRHKVKQAIDALHRRTSKSES